MDQIGGVSFQNGLLKHCGTTATQRNPAPSISAFVPILVATIAQKNPTYDLSFKTDPATPQGQLGQVHAECGPNWWSQL